MGLTGQIGIALLVIGLITVPITFNMQSIVCGGGPTVTLYESGLPSGMTWGGTITNVASPSDTASGSASAPSSITLTLQCSAPSGVSYAGSASGYTGTSGTLGSSGGTATVYFTKVTSTTTTTTTSSSTTTTSSTSSGISVITTTTTSTPTTSTTSTTSASTPTTSTITTTSTSSSSSTTTTTSSTTTSSISTVQVTTAAATGTTTTYSSNGGSIVGYFQIDGQTLGQGAAFTTQDTSITIMGFSTGTNPPNTMQVTVTNPKGQVQTLTLNPSGTNQYGPVTYVFQDAGVYQFVGTMVYASQSYTEMTATGYYKVTPGSGVAIPAPLISFGLIVTGLTLIIIDRREEVFV